MEPVEVPLGVSDEEQQQAVQPPPMWIFALLVLPNAIFPNGFVGTVMSSLLRRENMSLGDIANVTALISLPPTLYVLWQSAHLLYDRRGWTGGTVVRDPEGAWN